MISIINIIQMMKTINIIGITEIIKMINIIKIIPEVSNNYASAHHQSGHNQFINAELHRKKKNYQRWQNSNIFSQFIRKLMSPDAAQQELLCQEVPYMKEKFSRDGKTVGSFSQLVRIVMSPDADSTPYLCGMFVSPALNA